MKKRYLFCLLFGVILMFVSEGKAQIKLHDDGQVSLGSLTKTQGVQVHNNGYTSFRIQSQADNALVALSHSNKTNHKHWIVEYSGYTPNHTFYVTGSGYVHSNGNRILSDSRLQQDANSIDNAGDVINQISGISYSPIVVDTMLHKEMHQVYGVSAQEVEKVIPEAVSTDENGILYVNYETLTVFLIEAVKEQRQEIELLRNTLEANGLLKP